MKKIIVLFCLTLSVSSLLAQKKILFDNTKSETAGNADWVIDNDQPIPSPSQSGITAGTAETYWTGGLSSWGVEMVKQGFVVETLPSAGTITYGNSSNAQDLSNYDVFVVCEPNNPFSTAEKTAMMNFVYNGGGLFIVADHAIADRDGDGWDALEVWNDFITNNPVKNNAFGFVFDAGSNISADPTLNVSTLANDPILHGVKGEVLGISFFNGGMMTISTSDNSSVKAAVYQTGYSNTGTTGVMVAYSTYGSGRVVAVGDSSVPEDETAQDGTTYPGWTQPNVGSVADGDDGVLMTNATVWLSQGGGSVTVDPEPTNNVTNFSTSDVTSSSIKLTWTDATGGTVPAGYLIKWNTSSSITNPVDGVAETNGTGVVNVSQGVQTSTITGLSSNTTYYFKIYPYTNSGNNIDYLVSSTPSANAKTLVGSTIINSEDFSNCSTLTWTAYDVSGDDYWTCGSGYEVMNGYGGTVDEDWLISPALNLNSFSSEILTFKTATQYTGPDLELVYSTDYDGYSNPSTQGTWNSLSFTKATTTTFTSSGNVSLSGISGTSVYIAFRYVATGVNSGEAALWEVDDIFIEGYSGGDSTPPYILTYSPTDNTSSVAATDNLVLSFSEDVTRGTSGNITIYNSNSTEFEVIPYDDARIAFSNATVTINPNNTFVGGSSYYVNIGSSVIQDMSGNFYAGINNSTTWNFTTQTGNSVIDPSKEDVLIYPNPTNGIVKIKVDDQLIRSVKVYDLTGKELLVRINSDTIDFSGLNKGVYIIRINTNDNVYLTKVVKN